MDAEALGHFIDEHYNRSGDRLFRMEVLPEYEVTSDGEDFRRWLEGATEPTWTRKQPWLDTLRKERENGQISTRVRILSNQVTDYERYACGFGYRYNGEYEDIRVLHRGEHEIPADLIETRLLDYRALDRGHDVLRPARPSRRSRGRQSRRAGRPFAHPRRGVGGG